MQPGTESTEEFGALAEGDSLAATHAVMGVLMALHHRERTGRGQVVDAAIYESVLAMMENLITEYDITGYVRERSGSILPGIAPSNVYPAANGEMILIGGNGPRLLALAAREADIVSFSGITFREGGASPPDLSAWRAAAVDERIRLVREAAGEERYARIELNALVQRVIVTEDRHAAAAELARRWPELSPDEILQTPYVLVGTVEQMVEDLQARRRRWGISYYAIHEPYLDDFAPVVARLAGK